MRPAVIFDMDGTLANCRHRLHFVRGPGKKNWQKFFEQGKDDPPKVEIIRLAVELSINNSILIASGRPEHLRKDTERWLKQQNVPYDAIFLRKDNDRRPDGTVKSEMLALMHAQGYSPWLAVDDRDSAVQAWRDLGITCLQC